MQSGIFKVIGKNVDNIFFSSLTTFRTVFDTTTGVHGRTGVLVMGVLNF